MRGWTITGVAGFAAFCFSTPADAALPEWREVTPFEINNPGVAATGLQVELTINTQNLIAGGVLDANADDMRFAYDCAGDELIPFWIMPGTLGTTTTRVWVVVDLPPNNTLLLRMFHDNPGAANAESAIGEVFDGPHSATDQLTGGMTSANSPNSQRGFRFSPQRDLLVTDFGKNEPNGTSRSVTLWNFAGSSAIQTEQVSGAASQYSYGALAEPLWLNDGGDYVLSIFQDAAGPGYFFQPSSQINQHLSYTEMRYCNSCAALTFPALTLSNYHYGYPDIQFYIKQEPLQPPSVAIAGISCPEDATCDSDCSAAICGDGLLNTVAGEECDDGSIINGDGCSSTCLVEVDPGSSSGGGESSGNTSAGSGSASATDGTASSSATSGDPTSGGSDPTDSGPSGSGSATSPATSGGSSPTAGDGTVGGDDGTGSIPGLPSRGLGETGCSCTTGGSGPWAIFALLGLLGLRRRR